MEQLISTAKQFILQPKAAWEVAAGETSDAKKHILGYVAPLALIPAIASFIGYGIIGYGSFMGARLSSMEWGISQAIISYLGTILGVIISGFIIYKLAPNFGATVNMDSAVKLVGFSYTAAMVGGVFHIYYPLEILSIAASIYSLYILYIGFKPMTKVPDEKTTNYFIISIIATIAVYVVLGIILSGILVTIGFGAPSRLL